MTDRRNTAVSGWWSPCTCIISRESQICHGNLINPGPGRIVSQRRPWN